MLTGPGAEPLDVNVTGFYRNELVLKVEGRKYSQKTGLSVEPRYPGRLPFDTVPHEVTTWKKWRAAHPETDVVVEVPAAAGGR